MKDSRTSARRATSRTFRPTLDGRLEERVLLTRTVKLIKVAHGLLKHTKPRAAYNVNQPPFLAGDAPYFNRGRGFKKIDAVGIQTARGGQNVEVTATDGSHYMITLDYSSNTLATNIAEGTNGQGGASTSPRPRPSKSASRTPGTRSRSAPFELIRCRAGASESSWTARP